MKRSRRLASILVVFIALFCTAASAELVTNIDYPLIGSPRALKGGRIVYAVSSFPATFRIYGPNSNTYFISLISGLVYQTLVSVHPNTLEIIPSLAEAWEIGEDKRTFTFRLDGRARWADGKPVTVEDVIFSWELATSRDIRDPQVSDIYRRFERPEKIGERTVRFRAKTLHWRNFLFCGANLAILPKHIYEGKDYYKYFQWRMPPGSGPYMLWKFRKGRYIILKRRKDFWAESMRRNIGLYNFDYIKFVVVRDMNLELEKFKKGELDFYIVGIARKWVRELTPERERKIAMGWIQRRKVWTKQPSGVNGLVFNMRRPPFSDVRVRKALAYMFPRKKFMEKLFFNEYIIMDSYFPGSIYENPDNEKIRFDPKKAEALLREAGWRERNENGLLVKNGKPFAVTLLYASKASERHLTIYKEELRKIGIDLHLKLADWATMWKLVLDHNFEMASVAWSGMIFPNPEPNYYSKYADQKQTNNISGIKDPEIDRILEEYRTMFDLKDRIEALRELDSLIFRKHPYVLGWYGPFSRVLYWNKFGMPEYYLTKFSDAFDIFSLWWYDPRKDAALKEAMENNRPLGVGPEEIRYWLER